MKSSRLISFLCISLTSVIGSTSCDKNEPEDPIIPNEEEVVTSFNFTLTPGGGGSPVVLSFMDLDGDGGNPPTITGGSLIVNTNYSGAITLLNELETPTADISLEIEEEGAEHQFFFETTVEGLKVEYGDADVNGQPIGLSTTISTEEAGSGVLKITLRHQPDKNASGVSEGDISNAGGETDLEVTFNVEVQ
jgi:hypothetical protein